MKQHIKEWTARLAFKVSREVSKTLPAHTVFDLEPGDIRTIQQRCESAWYHFGVNDNPYCVKRDPIRHGVWQRQVKRIHARVQRATQVPETREIQWGLEGCHV